MRFYAKLILFVAAFLVLASSWTRGAAADVAYLVRVRYVLAFGSEADYQALIDDTQRALAAGSGRLDVYEAGKRYRAMIDRRLAEAARRHVALTDADVAIIHAQCMRDAYADVAYADVAYADVAYADVAYADVAEGHRPISRASAKLPPATPH